MGKEYRWEVQGHYISATRKENCYVLCVDHDYVTSISRLSNRQMRYGLEESVTILGRACLFVVWEEIPDLVVDGMMVHRGVEYAYAKKIRLHNMNVMYTSTAIFGLIAMAVACGMLYLGMISTENLHVFTALLTAGVWMVIMGLYYRGKWVALIDAGNG